MPDPMRNIAATGAGPVDPAAPLAGPAMPAGPTERHCSVGRAIDILSDAWSFLVIRECLFGARRFDEFQSRLGMPRQTLTERLKRLTDQGVLKRAAYQDRPPRHEYRLTAMGIDLYPSMIAMLRFGDRWLDGTPRVPLRLVHKPCGCHCQPVVACSHCGGELKARDVTYRDGPGAGTGPAPDLPRSRRSSDSRHYDRGRPSSVSRTLGIIGDRWTFKVTREAFLGARRFDDYMERLRIAPNILTDRLGRLVASGIFERRRYQVGPDRFEYRLTAMGLDLYGPFLAILAWGDRWLANDAAPMILRHRTCGADFTPRVVCDVCRAPLMAWEMRYERNYAEPDEANGRLGEYDP